jgi:hypothetical protein
MEYKFYENKYPKNYVLSSYISFGNDSFTIKDMDDYFNDDEDGYWEEYFFIKEENYEKILENIKKQFIPYSLTLFDDEITNTYDSINNKNLKLIFLYIISIINQYNYDIRSEKLVKILCGKNIEYTRDVYSKGP